MVYMVDFILFKSVFGKMSTAGFIAHWIKVMSVKMCKCKKEIPDKVVRFYQNPNSNGAAVQTKKDGTDMKVKHLHDDYHKKKSRIPDMLRNQQSFHKMRTKKKSALFDIGDESDDNSVHNNDDNSGDSGFFDHLSDDLSAEIVAYKRPNKIQPMMTYGYKTIDDF